MTNAEQRDHQRERLRALDCNESARSVAYHYWGMGLVPPAACVFADQEGTVIFEWETRGCHVELRISPEAQPTAAATAPAMVTAMVTAPCGCSVTSGYRCPVHEQP